jgi:hypothetical protein
VNDNDLGEGNNTGGGGMQGKILNGKALAYITNGTAGLTVPPKCDGPGEALRFNGTNWICEIPRGTVMGFCSEFENENLPDPEVSSVWPGFIENGIPFSGHCACAAGWTKKKFWEQVDFPAVNHICIKD